jgi:hypothetical protein
MRRLLAVAVGGSLLVASLAGAANADETQAVSPRRQLDPASEELGKRDAFAKHYRNEDGSMTAVISTQAVHRQKESGGWVDVDRTFRLTASGDAASGYSHIRSMSGFDVLVPDDGSGDYAIRVNGGLIRLSANSQLLFRTGDIEQPVPSIFQPTPTVAGDAQVNGVRPLLRADDRVRIGSRGVKHEIVLNERSVVLEALGRGADELVIRDVVELPEGWSLAWGDEVGQTVAQGAIDVLNANGNVVGFFPIPKAHDNTSPRQYKTGYYQVAQSIGSVWVIDTLFDAAWLMHSDRTFPIV